MLEIWPDPVFRKAGQSFINSLMYIVAFEQLFFQEMIETGGFPQSTNNSCEQTYKNIFPWIYKRIVYVWSFHIQKEQPSYTYSWNISWNILSICVYLWHSSFNTHQSSTNTEVHFEAFKFLWLEVSFLPICYLYPYILEKILLQYLDMRT